MKRSSIYIYSGVWVTSIALSFFIGRSLSSAGSSSDQLPADVLAAKLAMNNSGASSELIEAALNDGDLDGAALEQLQQQSTAMTRRLLNAAFDLPLSDPSRASTINDLLKQLAATDPLAALEFADSITSLRDAERARNDILQVWASHEPLAALAWADANLGDVPSNLRESQMMAILRGYAETNPKAAFSYANSLSGETKTEQRLKNRLLSEVIETQIRAGGLADAQATIAQLPDGTIKDNLQRELVNEWASFDPESAAAYVQSLGDDASTNLKTTLISEWSRNDPAAAAAWMSNLSTDDPAYGRATAEITREWTRYDLTASSEWLNSLEASPELDRAVATYTMRASEEDPSTAMSWAESISSDRVRERMIEQVAANWKSTDPEGFTEYLDASDLSDAERESLESARSWEGGRGGGGGGGGGGRGGRGR